MTICCEMYIKSEDDIMALFMQICEGKVTTLHLYQGAFVDIGGVYDGYVQFFMLIILLDWSLFVELVLRLLFASWSFICPSTLFHFL